jgi:perosamine synthetase
MSTSTTTTARIPISKPLLGEAEIEGVTQVLRSGWITQGPAVKAFEAAFAQRMDVPHAVAVSNCTTALHLGLLAVGVQPGDVVLTVSHSYIATANSIRHCGAEPVFVDIDPDTFNMNPTALARTLKTQCQRDGKGVLRFLHPQQLNSAQSCFKDWVGPTLPRVAAIVVVHQMGMPADLAALMPLARQAGLPVVEDAACAIGSQWLNPTTLQWQPIGYCDGETTGDVVCFSFHPRKIVTTGDGGMITTHRADYDQQFRLLRQHGMDIPDTVRHQANQVLVESYPVMGFNYRLTDLQAAVGLAQLDRLDSIIADRHRLYERYQALLGDDVPWLALPHNPPYARSNWQSLAVRVLPTSPYSRDEWMQRLWDAGISTKPGIMNAHAETPYQCAFNQLPESDQARQTTLLVPFFNGLTEDDLDRIVGCFKGV